MEVCCGGVVNDMNRKEILSELESAPTLVERLADLHERILRTTPAVDRIACALYDPDDDELRTFINSTRRGTSLTGYAIKLSDSPSLSALARSGDSRVISEIRAEIGPNSAHSRWLLEQGYRSSFTVPMYGGDALLGFIFFDASEPDVFRPPVQRDLALSCNHITMAVSGAFNAVRTLRATTRLAREFAGMRDFETGLHLERVARYAREIGQVVGPPAGKSDDFVHHVYLFAPLHDIGKVGIPDQILLKPGALTVEERAVMQTHVEKGCAVLERALGELQLHDLPDATILFHIIRSHHELLDGSGYPNGIRGDAIPLEARIVSVADVFDALTSERPYKKVWSFDDAYTQLDKMVGEGKLDAGCVAALWSRREAVLDIATRYRDVD